MAARTCELKDRIPGGGADGSVEQNVHVVQRVVVRHAAPGHTYTNARSGLSHKSLCHFKKLSDT